MFYKYNVFLKASYYNYQTVVNALVQANASLNIMTKFGETALMIGEVR